jgi:hypothetical protein
MTRKRNTRQASLSSAADDTVAASAASSPAPNRPPQNKKAKFEERYNAGETSDADILGEPSII